VSFAHAGNCVIDANQAGNADYGAAPQVQQTVSVGPGAQTITFTSTPPNNATLGGTYNNVAATSSSGLPVALKIDASATSVCSISGSTVRFTGTGNCVIDTSQAGNADYGAAPQVQQTIAVGKDSQSIAFTSTPPTPSLFGATYNVAATGGGSPNPVTFTTPTSGVCTVSGTSVSFTGVGNCVIDANQAGNANYNAAPQLQQSFAVSKAPLTVTANNVTKQFGAVVPQPLTATITGFVNGQTLSTSGVTGSAACSTTATASSPSGSYPITCTQGTLSASNYNFTTFNPGTLAVGFAKTITGSFSGQLNVGPGQPVLLGPGSTVTGPVTIQPGGSLEVDGATITGPLNASGAATVRLCGATVTGATTIRGATGLVVLGDDDGPSSCAGNKFGGSVSITKGTGGVEFDANTVTGPLTITGNAGALAAPDTGAVDATRNTVSGPSNVQTD
jgi:hypothetical protein